MDKLKELEIRASDLRVEINRLATSDDADLDKLGELRSEYEAVETRIAALKLVDDAAPGDGEANKTANGDGESAELEGILQRAELGAIYDAVLNQRSTDGAEAELQDHFGLAGNQVPLAMLETRAVTPAPRRDRGDGSAGCAAGICRR